MRVKARRSLPPARPRVFSRRVVLALLLLLSAGAVKAAWPTGAAPTPKKAAATGLRSRYIAIPHGASTELRRQGAYWARKLNLPLIAEPNVTEVVIKEFRP